MKTKIKLFAASVIAAVVVSFYSSAQSSVLPTSASLTNAVPGFTSEVASYFTTINTNLVTFTPSRRFDLWTGAEYVNGLNVADSLGLSYKPLALASTIYLQVESVTKNAGIAGTILSQQAGVGLAKVYYDVQIEGYVDGGYSFLNKEGFGELGVRAKKAMTQNTYTGLGLSFDFSSQHTSTRPNVVIFAGFTF